jgi:hypothetical protein
MIKPTARSLLALVLALTSVAQAQTLARPGWAGSGMSNDIWWKHAVLYQVNPANFSVSSGTPLHGVTERLDYIRSLGVDAVLLTAIQPDANHAQAISPALGTLDDLDDLIHEASRRDIRVLLDLDPQISSSDLPNVARFWLNRGIAGFHVIGSNDAAHAQGAMLRKATSSYLGQRILVGDVDTSLPSDPRQRSYKTADPLTPQLSLDLRPGTPDKLTAAAIRPALELTQDVLQAGHTIPLIASDGPGYKRSMSRYADGQHDIAIAKVMAAVLFTSHAGSLLYYGQELGVTDSGSAPLIAWDAPPAPAKGKPIAQPTTSIVRSPNAAVEDSDPSSLLNWYRKLSDLHHGNATIASGTSLTINRDDQNALVLIRKPQTVSPISPVLFVLCNLSAQPVQLNLKPDTLRLHLRGSFLRTLLRSDNGMGTMHLESMTLAPYAVYIGELRY